MAASTMTWVNLFTNEDIDRDKVIVDLRTRIDEDTTDAISDTQLEALVTDALLDIHRKTWLNVGYATDDADGSDYYILPSHMSKVELVVHIDTNGNNHYKETDNYFVKIKKIGALDSGEPVIPGGSLKGIFRSRAEKILRTLSEHVCDPTDSRLSCSSVIKNMLDINPQIKKKEGSDRYKEVEKKSCLICKIFGNSYLASKTIFSDAKISGFETKKFDGVAINRFTSGPVESALFTSMPAIKGEFKWSIKIHKPENEEIVLLMFVLKDLINSLNPISIGYGKTKGFGMVETDASSVMINGNCYSTYIENNKDLFKEWKTKRGKKNAKTKNTSRNS